MFTLIRATQQISCRELLPTLRHNGFFSKQALVSSEKEQAQAQAKGTKEYKPNENQDEDSIKFQKVSAPDLGKPGDPYLEPKVSSRVSTLDLSDVSTRNDGTGARDYVISHPPQRIKLGGGTWSGDSWVYMQE